MPNRLKKYTGLFAALLVSLGLLVLTGFQLNIEVLMRPMKGFAAMNPVTAVCFLLLGAALFLQRSLDRKNNTTFFLSLIILLAGSSRIFAFLSGYDLPLDNILYRDHNGIPLNRMAFNTAICFVLSAGSLLILRGRRKGVIPSQYFALVIFLIAFLSLTGYFYHLPEFVGSFMRLPMAIHTSVGFIIFSIGILSITIDKGIMNVFTERRSGSIIANRLIPFAIVIPLLLGYIELKFYWLGVFSAEFCVAQLVTIIVILFVSLIWYNSLLLNRRDYQQQKIEISLRESESKFRDLLESAPDAMIIVNRNGIIQLVNNQTEVFFGYKKQDLINEKVEILMPGKYSVRSILNKISLLENPLTRNTIQVLELDGKRKEGIEFPVEISFSLLNAKDDFFALVSIRDITQRRKNENRLRQFSFLLEKTNDAVITMSTDYIIKSWNKGAEKMYGYTRDEVLDKPLFQFIKPGSDEKRIQSIVDDLKEKGSVAVETTHGTRAGVRLNMKTFTALVTDEKGDVEGYISIFTDVTHQKKEEERLQQFNLDLERQVNLKTEEIKQSEDNYRTLIEQASDAIFISDQQGNYLDVNNNACILVGYSREEILSMKSLDLLFPEDRASLPSRIDDLRRGKHFLSERRLRKKDGSALLIESSAKMLSDGRLLGIVRDITERKKIENEILQSREQLRNLAQHIESVREEERTHVAREIHDELGQQLTGIKMDLALLKYDAQADKNIPAQSIMNVMSLIDTTIKTVRKISSDLRPGILDDLGLVAALEWQSNEFAKRFNIKSDFQTTIGELDLARETVTGIFRIFQESLTNVARHSEATEVVSFFGREKNLLILNVHDNGKGFSADGKESKTLGIVGMKERALMLGGEFIIQSEQGKGTTVILKIPNKD